MTKKMIKIVAAPTIAVMLTIPASAQLGGILGGMFGMSGLPVYDASSAVQQMMQYAKMSAQLVELVAIYEKATAQYSEMKRQALAIKGLAGRYQSPNSLWRGLSANNFSGKTAAYVQAVNQRVNAGQAWTGVTDNYFNYSNVGQIPSNQLDRKMTAIAGIEIADGTASSAIDSIGAVRLSGPGTEQALKRLEDDSLSDSDPEQVAAAQRAKANAISILLARELSNANKIGVANAEIALMRLRSERQAAAYSLNNDVAFRRDGLTALQSSFNGASSAMTSYRIP